MQMTLGSSEKAAGDGCSAPALLSNNSSFKDPFAALAQCSEPWQELDVEPGRSAYCWLNCSSDVRLLDNIHQQVG
jgi:hypothetical protein